MRKYDKILSKRKMWQALMTLTGILFAFSSVPQVGCPAIYQKREPPSKLQTRVVCGTHTDKGTSESSLKAKLPAVMRSIFFRVNLRSFTAKLPASPRKLIPY